jgi:hypothetical protein
LLRTGTKTFGEPGAATVSAVAEVREPDRLEAVCLRIIDPDVHTWEDLLRGS